jgi:uncharacterized glyoxalase superfamily protein PhnB
MSVKAIPDGFHTVTPYMIVEGASKLIDFLKQVFEATEMNRMNNPNKSNSDRILKPITFILRLYHELRIGRCFVKILVI